MRNTKEYQGHYSIFDSNQIMVFEMFTIYLYVANEKEVEGENY